MSIVEDYLREFESSLRVEPARRRQIVDELRSHVQEKVSDLARTSDAARVDLERAVLADLGSPRDLALAYEPEGHAVLKNQAGEVVLRLGGAVGRGARAVGRGMGAFLKWAAVAMGILLVIAIGVGVWAFYEVRPVLQEMAAGASPIYDYGESCEGTPCNGQVPGDRFYVPENTTSLRFHLEAYGPWRDDANATGTVRVVVQDPQGNVAYNRTLTLSEDSSSSATAQWAPTPGNWTVSYEFDAFRGRVEARAYASSDGSAAFAEW